MVETEMKENLIDVLRRLVRKTNGNLPVNTGEVNTQVVIRQFCTDYIMSDEELIQVLRHKLGTYGMATTVPYLILIAHIMLVTGMRYTHDYGCPEAVRDLFKESEFFMKLEGELKE